MSTPKPVSLVYPIVFIGGVLFLCAWAVQGNRVFAIFPLLTQEIAEDIGAD
jgi:hypothetical protein